MNNDWAVAYCKAHGCRYMVTNSVGGLLGGFKTMESAIDCQSRFQEQYSNDPLNSDIKVYITEVE